MISEDQLEQHCLEWFDNGWETLYGPDTAPDAAKHVGWGEARTPT